MKKLCIVCGIVLIICGLMLYFIAGVQKDNMQPQEIKYGYVQDGKYIQTDSGFIGGNPEGEETMGALQIIGIMAMVGGGIMALASLAFKAQGEV